MRIFVRYFCLIALLLTFGCKERFTPEIKENNNKLLVVEGMISLGAVRTQIKLSRTVPVSEKGSLSPESGAKITIESNASQIYSLVERGAGEYESAVLNLDPSRKYRLRIISKGSEYLTDYLEARVTPEIEDISWEAKPNGIQVYLNTRDNTNNSRYYRWNFEETWIFYANYNSTIVWNSGRIRLRDRDTEDIYKCWATANSSNIVLGSSVKLSNDVINKQPITFIPHNSEKLSEKYSILINQSVLTKDAFDFWENLRRNTESLGTIFDALPSQLTGNVINVKNPSEPVLGFVSVGEVKSKRIFISKAEIPVWIVESQIECAAPDTIPVNQANIFSNPNYVPLEEIFSPFGTVMGYSSTPRECGDCTTRGTNRRPAFWQ